VRGLRRGGGRIATSTRVDAARPDGDGWRLDTTDGEVGADVVVNAAGAWGDVVAVSAGVEPIGHQPCRRTAFMVNGPGGDTSGWAFTADVEHRWYVKDDGPQMLCSLGEETPSEPCDAKPEEVDVALAIERINEATTLAIRSVNSSWTGLRTFAPDRSLVIGPDPNRPAFVWCVGQGGCGIQTSAGAGRLLADLALGGDPSATFGGADISGLLPGRFRAHG
jgi:D-arginine dehydrogenase